MLKKFCFKRLLNIPEFVEVIGDVAIVDVGAQILDYENHIYKPLVDNLQTSIVGFEPVDEARDKYSQDDDKCKVFPYVVGDGRNVTFYETNNSALSSVFKPNIELRQRFVGGHNMYGIKSTQEVTTKRLDDIAELNYCDFLKLDTQGGEVAVVNGAKKLLKDVLVIHTEAFFIPFYEGMPLWADLDPIIRGQGFELVDLFPLGRRLTSFGANTDKFVETNLSQPSRLVWGDFCYIKEPKYLSHMPSEKILKAALIMHFLYQKFEFSAQLLDIHDKKYGTDYLAQYFEE